MIKKNLIFEEIDNILSSSLNRENRVIENTTIYAEPNPMDDLANQIQAITDRHYVQVYQLKAVGIYEKYAHHPSISRVGEITMDEEIVDRWKQKRLLDIPEEYKLLEIDWLNRKQEFYRHQNEYNAFIADLRERYFNIDNSAIIEYNRFVLEKSIYPKFIRKNFELEYNSTTRTLLVEYFLPHFDEFPKIKEIKEVRLPGVRGTHGYYRGGTEDRPVYISEAALFKIFDKAIYNITLRVLHELFETDEANVLDAINFNGWVESVDRATGQNITNCILSIQVTKEEFQKINLANVEPKICFKHLKGVASSKLSSITPIQPILQINKNDKRFVATQRVDMDDSTNLAAMDWEDFEHLIREIFEKEFSSNGGEVKVTQASRDGGVDAVAFDPDPIRGGKIVIQAKRYTNTVGVSAVRDLYGTVLNEGANKGILVTTSDYGSDSYEFAKGKPLTLLNGSNLLYLLEKHGHKARIDIREARLEMKANFNAE